jgi:mercuric ion binding protein
MKKSLLVSSLFALFSLPLWGAEQTVTLDVPGMTCAACPITVKTALKRMVSGMSMSASRGAKPGSPSRTRKPPLQS